ncbi:hypothetical protein CERZMDRAFT_103189 [Cercospora zeae-maydis SCOH1-5]|uniref:Uncharacterized protein n=1 Tax=Cercospora zeae-maydis SCOH1-5 TaxID=717836 RepID=A0A6A6EWP0_9PEZI|nr:hypothetical protein CERZMDRAFT_103189 [Cercospora zeae-maydis SCOH1-5]
MEFPLVSPNETGSKTSLVTDTDDIIAFPSNPIPIGAIHASFLNISSPPPPLPCSNPQPKNTLHNQIDRPSDVADYMSYTFGNLAYIFHATLDEIKNLERVF